MLHDSLVKKRSRKKHVIQQVLLDIYDDQYVREPCHICWENSNFFMTVIEVRFSSSKTFETEFQSVAAAD